MNPVIVLILLVLLVIVWVVSIDVRHRRRGSSSGHDVSAAARRALGASDARGGRSDDHPGV
jgi:hypothetical protein